MTNITLSIDDEIYKKMKKYSETKWSESVRKSIEKYLKEIEVIEESDENESVFTMLASQEVLKKDWDNDLDDRWNNI